MDELIHYYSVDVSVVFDIDLDSDQIDTELTSDIHDTFVEELQEAFKNNPDVDLEDYDWGWDKEHDYIQYLYISSKLDKAAVTPIVENILDSIVSFERTDELWDGTYSVETHGLDTPPYEHIANTRDYTYSVDVETDILRFFETNEDGEVLQEAVTKNELKARAEKHRKKQRGITTLNPDAGNVEYNIGMFNKMHGAVEGPSNNPVSGPFGGDVSSGDALTCCEALKLPEIEDPYKEFEFTKEEKLLAKELQRASNYCSNFRVKIGEGTYALYEDGVLLEQFESIEDLLEYCEMYSSLTVGRSPSERSERLFVENNAKLLDVLRKLPKGTRFYVVHKDSDEVFRDKYVGITSPDIEAVKKILKIYTFDQLYQIKIAKDKQQKRNAEIADMPSSHTSYRDALIAGHAFRREIADYARSNDDADYRAGVFEQLNDLVEGETVFMESYEFTETEYIEEVGLNDYFESMNKEVDE